IVRRPATPRWLPARSRRARHRGGTSRLPPVRRSDRRSAFPSLSKQILYLSAARIPVQRLKRELRTPCIQLLVVSECRSLIVEGSFIFRAPHQESGGRKPVLLVRGSRWAEKPRRLCRCVAGPRPLNRFKRSPQRPGSLAVREPSAVGPLSVRQPLNPSTGGSHIPPLTQHVAGIEEPLARIAVRVSEHRGLIGPVPESSVRVLKRERVPASSGGRLPELLPPRDGMELQKGNCVLRVYAASVAEEPSGILNALSAQSHC